MKNPEIEYEIADMEWAEAKAEAALRGISTSEFLWGELRKGEQVRMATLMELSGEYRLLLNTMDSAEPEEIQVFEDTLESVLAEVGDKADAYAVVISEAKAAVEKFKAESERLGAIVKRYENSIDYMKLRLKQAMEEMGMKELKGDFHKFRIQKNGGKKPMQITGEVPDNYKKIVYEDDKEKIRKALEDGEELAFAHLEERGTHLRID